MKKRTAFVGAILSLMPLGQPLLIKTGVVLSSIGLILSVPKKVNAESFHFYIKRGDEKIKKEDYYGAIFDFTKAIEIQPNNALLYSIRSYPKVLLKDYIGAISDLNKAIKIDPNEGSFYKLRGNYKYLLNKGQSACIDWSKAATLGDKDGISNIKKWC